MTTTKLQQITQKLPYLLGIALILVGLIGFLPGGHAILGIPHNHITGEHNLIHLLTGIGTIFFAFTKSSFGKVYFTLMGLLYLFLVISGIVLDGNIWNIVFVELLDNILHFLIALLCFWFAYFPPFNSNRKI
jgi:Domain of unknown function (DUF4383)